MNGRDYADYVKSRILARFPFFNLDRSSGEYLCLEHKSNLGKLTLWLIIQSQEITLGLNGDAGLNDWHTHMVLLGAKSIDEEIQLASQIIDDIISGKQPIIFSSVLGYFLSENPNEACEYKLDNEIVSIVSWRDL
jgi:hypothetical protein